MTDHTDTISVPDLTTTPPPDSKPAQPASRPPGNTFLIIATVLLTGVAGAMFTWMNDPKITRAQVSLIASVVLVVGAGTALIGHLVRVWIHAAEGRINASVVKAESRAGRAFGIYAKQDRARSYDLSSDVGSTYSEVQSLRARIVDFIKRYPPAGENQADVTQQIGELGMQVAHLTARAELAMEAAARQRKEVDTVVEGLVRHISKLTAAIERDPAKGITERLDGLRAEVEERISTLVAQQETLADLVSDPGRVVLAMPDSDMYELGRRYGQDEGRRENGKDQTS